MKAINYPFRLDEYGRVVTTSDPYKMYTDRLLTLVSTVVRQRTMRPEYGTDLATALYVNGNDEAYALPTAIKQAVKDWMPGVIVQHINIRQPGPDGISYVEVIVALPDQTTATVGVNSAYLSQNGTTY